MYGLPKLIELDSIKSPIWTLRENFSPSGIIFSFVQVIYRESADTSPILTQFIPSSPLVIYFSIGLGEPPSWINTQSPN